MKKKKIYPLNLTLSLVIITIFTLTLKPIRSWGQINNPPFDPSLFYNQPNFQFNYPFSSSSQNIYNYGSTLSGLRSFTSLPTSLTNLSFSSLTTYPSFTGSGINYYPPGGIPSSNFPIIPVVSSPQTFPTSPVVPFTPINFPQLFPILPIYTHIYTPILQFPPMIWPGPITFPPPFTPPFPPQPTPQPQSGPKKLFQKEHTNYAVGYYHKGIYITEEGKVYTFKNKGFSEEQGDEIKYAYTLDPSVLEEKRNLIYPASLGSLSEPAGGATDVGNWVYSAFLGNKEIILKVGGTYFQENESPAAKALVSWIENIYLELHAEEQTKLFQVEYTNYAWGYQHSGFFIDKSAGHVFTFKNKGNSPEAGDTYKVVKTIDGDVLSEKNNLITGASEGPYSERTHTAYDAGAKVYSAFLGYDGILLLETGDYTQENLSSQAQELVDWLKEIEFEISQQ